jgi:DNA polymerase
MIVAGDFETYYTTEYSLMRMSEAEYILDPRFEPIMLSLKMGDGPSRPYFGRDNIAAVLDRIDWSQHAWLSHNVRFDGAILGWIFGHYPAMYLDTLSMSRATTHWTIGRSSLAKVADYLGLPAKGDEVDKARGKRLADFTRDELRAYAHYCIRDNELCYAIFKKMQRVFRASELKLIDLVARMFIEPQVKLNKDVLEQNYQRVMTEKERVMAQVALVPKSVFASNQQFAKLLEDNGVEVPVKVSPRTGKMIPALAKNDWQFKELCTDDTQPMLIQSLLAARTSVKSTLEETRSRNLLKLAQLPNLNAAPIALKYSGARTHRLSGDGKLNWQNLPRGSLLRKAIEAPGDRRIVHRDASQIEARMTAWMARCDTLLEAFEQNRDVYSEFASRIYGETVTKSDTLRRFVGKTAILGLGYGCGAEKFRQMLFIGNGGISVKVDLTAAQAIVYSYRDMYPEIPALWRFANDLLCYTINNERRIPTSTSRYYGNHYAHIPIEPDTDCLILPSDLRICYPKIREEIDTYDPATGRVDTVYNDPYGIPRKIYGAKCVENISQALSRIIITDIAVRVHRLTGYHPFMTTHDSLDYCVPRSEAEAMDAELACQFALVPEWGAGLPLASEGGWGTNLAAAEQAVNN